MNIAGNHNSNIRWLLRSVCACLFYAWFSNTETSSIQKTLRNTAGTYSIKIDDNVLEHLPELDEKVLGKKHK